MLVQDDGGHSRSPKLNGPVERAQRTPTEEFEVIPDSFQLPLLNRQLRSWERIYNTVRPQQALGSLTPQPSSSPVPIP